MAVALVGWRGGKWYSSLIGDLKLLYLTVGQVPCAKKPSWEHPFGGLPIGTSRLWLELCASMSYDYVVCGGKKKIRVHV